MSSPLTPKVIHSGWLTKRGAVRKSWKHRWFVVTANKEMKYYTTGKAETCLGVIDLSRVLSISPTDEKGVKPNSLSLTTAERVWVLSAESPEALSKWLHMLEVCVGVAKRLVTSQEGYLNKKGKYNKNWKRRYFALGKGWLFYFATEDDCQKFKRIAFFSEKVFRLAFFKYVRGSIPLEQAETEQVQGFARQITISTPQRVFHIEAENENDLNAWINAIRDSVGQFKGPHDESKDDGQDMGGVGNKEYESDSENERPHGDDEHGTPMAESSDDDYRRDSKE